VKNRIEQALQFEFLNIRSLGISIITIQELVW
jgi:hypothetical protein